MQSLYFLKKTKKRREKKEEEKKKQPNKTLKLFELEKKKKGGWIVLFVHSKILSR